MVGWWGGRGRGQAGGNQRSRVAAQCLARGVSGMVTLHAAFPACACSCKWAGARLCALAGVALVALPVARLRRQSRQVEVVLDVVLPHFAEELIALEAAEPGDPGAHLQRKAQSLLSQGGGG